MGAARAKRASLAAPRLSIVIPVYNEHAIMADAVAGLREKLAEWGVTYEIILSENGSRDETLAIANRIAEKHADVRVLHTEEANYGKALRRGIQDARADVVVCDEIDLCDVDFHRRALELLESGEADFVVGSKRLADSDDERPAYRQLATYVFNGLLRVMLGFHGTDTHGLKAFRRETVLATVRECLVDRDLFASELVIRSEHAGLRMREIPVRVIEKRPPSVNLFKRVPNVLKNLVRLFVAIRIRG
ncbi:MAG: glycosyltransferase [Deltaproteobacteria bacterium]|nr:glycosyltransferase [Deltaproteobacteria bacterium]